MLKQIKPKYISTKNVNTLTFENNFTLSFENNKKIPKEFDLLIFR